MKRRVPRFTGRLARWHEWAIYSSFATLALSGLIWLVLDTFVRIDGSFGPVRHPVEPWLLLVHGASAYLLLVVIGALIPIHVRLAWAAKRNLKSGLTTAGLMLLLTLTGLGLYYLSGEIARSWAAVLHWAIGIASIGALTLHAWIGRGWTARTGKRKGPI